MRARPLLSRGLGLSGAPLCHHLGVVGDHCMIGAADTARMIAVRAGRTRGASVGRVELVALLRVLIVGGYF